MTIYEEDLRLQHPCSVPWETMRAVPLGRHCAQCDHTVRDVSLLTEREVRVLIEERKRRRICISMRVYDDGTVHTAPDPVISVSSLFRKVRPLVLAASATLVPACVDESALSTFEQEGDAGYEDGGDVPCDDGGDAGCEDASQEDMGAVDGSVTTPTADELTTASDSTTVTPLPERAAVQLASYGPEKGSVVKAPAMAMRRIAEAAESAAPSPRTEARAEAPVRDTPAVRTYVQLEGF